MTTLTIMRYLPREVDPLVYNMSSEDPGDVSYRLVSVIFCSLLFYYNNNLSNLNQTVYRLKYLDRPILNIKLISILKLKISEYAHCTFVIK